MDPSATIAGVASYRNIYERSIMVKKKNKDKKTQETRFPLL